jgi:hypothetical protein
LLQISIDEIFDLLILDKQRRYVSIHGVFLEDVFIKENSMRFVLALVGMLLAFVVGVFVEHDFNVVNLARTQAVQTRSTCVCGSSCDCCSACLGNEKCVCKKCDCCVNCPGHK